MRLLIDTDAFCKLAVANLLSDAARLFGVEMMDCGRLPALPHMLRRGRLRRVYGDAACEAMLPVAEAMPAVADAPASWIERLAPLPAVDPGEAILLSVAAAEELSLVSGDARALQAVKDVERFAEALSGRVVVFEAILLGLCRQLGGEALRRHVEPLREFDTVTRLCFSPSNADPEEGLTSYYRGRAADLAPLVLWEPRGDGV